MGILDDFDGFGGGYTGQRSRYIHGTKKPAQGSAGTPCPECGARSSLVVSSRAQDDGSVKRRRDCQGCGHRFSTWETTGDPQVMSRPDIAEIDLKRLATLEADLARLAMTAEALRKSLIGK